MKNFFKDNGLSIIFFLLFMVALVGQAITGLREHNHEIMEEGQPPIAMVEYLTSGHFLQSTFENWESEFLQMALFVVLTVFLFQKGSSESKDPEKKNRLIASRIQRGEMHHGRLNRGGWILGVYKHSLTIALFLLFILSFLLHWYGSLKDYNEEEIIKGLPTETAMEYLGNSRFWFESFQNWQSEFLSVFAIVILSIFLRQKGSPQSKPVDESHEKTGE